MHRPFALTSLALVAATAPAQTTTTVTLSVANMQYTQNALSATSNTYVAASLRGLGSAGPNHLFSNWWWYRVAGDTQETSFRLDAAPNAPTRTVAAPTIVTSWPNVAGRNLFSAVLTNTLVSTGTSTGYLVNQLVVTNTSAAPLTIDIFAYADIDTNGSNVANDCYGNDRSQYVERTASLTAASEYYCDGADATMVTPWLTTTAGALPFLLSNTTVDNLTGWTGTLLNADCNGAFQWNRTIAPNASETYTTYLAVINPRPLESLYGSAGAGTPGLPTIRASERAITVPGAIVPRSFAIQLGNAVPTSLSVLVANFTQAALVVNGLQVWVDPIGAVTLFGLTDGSGADSRTFGVPGSATFAGLTLNHQYFVLDAGGVGGFASYTQGLAQTVGRW
jgi:hypothetical protein